MSLFRGFGVCAGIASAIFLAGCRSTQRVAVSNSAPRVDAPIPVVTERLDEGTEEHPSSMRNVSHETDAAPLPISETVGDEPVLGTEQLSLELLVANVKARNPSLQAAHAAWSAAVERYPQAIAFDDPMFQTMFAPATFASNSPTQSSYVLGVAQKVPWHGKRALRGQIAQWDADASSWDANEVQLRLEGAARIAFFDYYLAQRELELNQKNVEVTQDSRSAAKAKYEANEVSQQDLSLADLELAKLEQERLDLLRAEKIAIARINTLLHRSPSSRLPQSPASLEIDSDLQDVEVLREVALQHRPELASLSAKIQSEQAAIALACKEYYPDFEFMGRYDSFWTDSVQRPMIGMNMNIPLNKGKRGAAVREAEFRLTKLVAELNQQQDMVNEEVQVAHARVDASRKAAALYKDRILPAAEANLEAARAAYVAGSVDFLSLMSARREFIAQQSGYQRTIAEHFRSQADLQRAVGTNAPNATVRPYD